MLPVVIPGRVKTVYYFQSPFGVVFELYIFFIQSSAESYAGYQMMICLLIHFQKKINFCCFPAVSDFLRRGWGLGNSIYLIPCVNARMEWHLGTNTCIGMAHKTNPLVVLTHKSKWWCILEGKILCIYLNSSVRELHRRRASYAILLGKAVFEKIQLYVTFF